MGTTQFNRRKFAKTFALALLAIGTLSQAARAGDLSAQQIVDGLKAPKTRSLSATSAQPAPLSASDAAFIDRVRKTRSLSSADRDQVQQIAQSRPSVDVEIYFDYNSAALTPKAEPQLNNLGKALTSQDLSGAVVMLGGHTDAKGGDGYNQSLSGAVETTKGFLIDNYHVSADADFDRLRQARAETPPISSPQKTAAFRSSTWRATPLQRPNNVIALRQLRRGAHQTVTAPPLPAAAAVYQTVLPTALIERSNAAKFTGFRPRISFEAGKRGRVTKERRQKLGSDECRRVWPASSSRSDSAAARACA